MAKAAASRFVALLAVQAIAAGHHVLVKRALNADASPFVLCLLRALIAVPVLLAAAVAVDGAPDVGRRHLPRLALLGTAAVFGNQTLFTLGLQRTTPENAAIFQPLIPVLTALISVAVGIEKIQLRSREGFAKLAGIIVAISGSFVMLGIQSLGSSVDKEDMTRSKKTVLLGNLCLLGNCICYSIFVLVQKPLRKLYHPLRIMFWVYLVGAGLLVLPTIPLWNSPEQWRIGKDSWIAVAYAGILSSALAMTLVSWSVREISPSVVTLFIVAQPFFTQILSWMVFGSIFTARQWIGATLIIVGLLLVSWAQMKENTAQSTSEEANPLTLEEETCDDEEDISR